MKALRQGARRQLEQFLSTLFLPDELIELRFIEGWVSRGKKKSRVVRAAQWLRRDEFVSQHREITDFARRERSNVYFGVCPRPMKGDSQDDCIRSVRCLWCDIDDITVEEAFERWTRAKIPRPSIVVSSGSGVHGYWLLKRDLRLRDERSLIASMLPHFYRSFGGDHVQNLSRVMRPPGTVNYKDARNGRPPRPCRLCTCQPEAGYALEAFSEWIEQAEEQRRQRMPSGSAKSPTEVSAKGILARNAEAAALVCQLGKPSRDRSRRDFAVVCDLLRLGLTKEEIWPLVCGSSKFESNGRPYFNLTITNAERTILLDRTPADDDDRSTESQNAPKQWYFVCPRCDAKWFAPERVYRCPRCGIAVVAKEKLVPPWCRRPWYRKTSASSPKGSREAPRSHENGRPSGGRSSQ